MCVCALCAAVNMALSHLQDSAWYSDALEDFSSRAEGRMSNLTRLFQKCVELLPDLGLARSYLSVGPGKVGFDQVLLSYVGLCHICIVLIPPFFKVSTLCNCCICIKYQHIKKVLNIGFTRS